ncbi:Zinc finger and BTB domain-containing protein 48 [Portunus trituberculatus]|uniref:Zinc finger and BTB domain-containing protein 48 n=1 Tax=Portunus trituberculatus TaxID=210409 RepID=A0A5B7DVX6_PORTR|nr:Zinc finger and BTB domain-containing protein 48 [Portunus trituberculatus]
MRGSDVEGEEHGTETTTNTQSYQTFLPPPTPAAAPTFITGATDSFLALPEQMEGEGEGLLGSGEGDGVSQGSLLYLDSASALHVLVHHLPQPSHQPTPPQLVEEEGSEEQFVVVGALKNEDELATSASPTTCHVSVESILEEELAGGRGEIYLPQPQEPTPAPQHLPQAPVLALVDGSGSGDTGDTTGITLDTVPHITLEEIIQKFASSPGSPIDDLDDSTTTTITAITPPPDPAPLPPPPPTVSPRVKTCGKGFKQLAQLLNHQVQHITSPKDFPAWAEKSYCEECQHWFRDRKSLRMHISLVHLKRKPHSCPHCPYRCSRSFDLKVHMRQHTGERPHRCPLCGWQTRDHNSMRRHKLGHQERKPFRCPLPLCQFETRHPAYFKRHMARRHLDNEALYACLFCPLTTPSLQDYIKHSMKHEKDLAEEAMKRAMQADTDTPGDATTAPREEPTPVTTAIALTTEDATKKTSPIDFNHKVGFIAIKFDDAAASDGKGETVDEVVVEEVEGESVSGVSLPQVVVSGSNGHYLLDIPGIGEDGEARVISSAPPQHHIITTTTATSHYTTPQLPHNTSLQDCSTTT